MASLWLMLAGVGVAQAVNILGLFPPAEYNDSLGVLHVDHGAVAVQTALRLAVEDINANGTIVNGTLTLHAIHSEGIPVLTMRDICEDLAEHGAHGVVGPPLTAEANWLAAASGEWLHLPAVTYAATASGDGGNVSSFLFHAGPDVETEMLAMVTAVLQQKAARDAELDIQGDDKERVALVSTRDDYGAAAHLAFRKAAEEFHDGAAAIDIVLSDHFAVDPYADFSWLLHDLELATAKIIILMGDGDSYPVIRSLLTQARDHGMLASDIQWWLSDGLVSDDLFDIDFVTRDEQLAYDMRGALAVRACAPTDGIGSEEAAAFAAEWAARGDGGGYLYDGTVDSRLAYTYDTVWMLARAIGAAQEAVGGVLPVYNPESCGLLEGPWEHGELVRQALHEGSATGATGVLNVGAPGSHFGGNSRPLHDTTFCLMNLQSDEASSNATIHADEGDEHRRLSGSNATTGMDAHFHTLMEWDRADELGFVVHHLEPLNQTFPAGGWHYPYDHPTLEGKHVSVLVKDAPPFVIVTTLENGTEQFSGISVDFLEALARDIGFTYSLYNAHTDDDHDHEMLDSVLHGEYDMSIAKWTITQARIRNMSFSHPYWDLGMAFATQGHPAESEFSVWSVFEPFEVNLWLAIMGAMLLTVVLFWIFEAPHNDEFSLTGGEAGTVIQDLGRTLYVSLALLFGQLTHKPETAEGYILTIGWTFVTFILVATYTGNVASFLTAGAADESQELSLDLLRSGNIHPNEVALQTNSTFEEIYQRDIIGCTHACEADFYHCEDIEDCIRAVLNREALLTMAELDTLEYAKATYACELEILPGLIEPQSYGIVLPLGTPYLEEIQRATLHLRQIGFTTQLHTEYLSSEHTCEPPTATEDGATAMGVVDLGGLFLILGAFMLVALAAWFTAMLKRRKAAKADEPASYEHMTRSERKRLMFELIMDKYADNDDDDDSGEKKEGSGKQPPSKEPQEEAKATDQIVEAEVRAPAASGMET